MYGKFNFFSFNKGVDWQRGWAANLVCADDGLSIPQTQKYIRRRLITSEEMGMDHRFVDVANGPHGLMFLLDENGAIWIYDYRTRRRNVLLESGHGLFTGQAMMTISGNYLYLAESYPDAPVTGFSLTLGQTFGIKLDLTGGRPLALTAAYGNELLLVVGRENRISNETLSETLLELEVLKITPAGHPEVWASIPGFSVPAGAGIDISAFYAASGKLYILEGYSGRLWVLNAGKIELEGHQLKVTGRVMGLGVDKDGQIYTGDGHESRPEINDARFLWCYPNLDASPNACLAYPGWANKLMLDQEKCLYIWNSRESAISILEQQSRINPGFTGSNTGVYIFPAFDSTVMETEWHRLTLEAEIPDDTQIKLAYFAADSQEIVLQGRLVNLDAVIKDETILSQDKMDLLNPLWSKALVNPKDALFRNARGRFLWVKMELIGSETNTPHVQKTRVYFPRMTLLDYLPAVYQENAASRDFLARFLAIFGSMLEDMEEKIDEIASLFDPAVVSGSMLSWLAGWLGIAVDENWSDEQLQNLVMQAPYIYARRGTREALEIIIEIYTGVKPLIVEHFQYKHFQDTTELKDLMDKLYGQDPYSFTVLINPETSFSAGQMAALQSILTQEKPAFTDARLVVLQPWMYMDMHSYLGINTYLSELTPLKLDNKSAVPFNSLIIDYE